MMIKQFNTCAKIALLPLLMMIFSACGSSSSTPTSIPSSETVFYVHNVILSGNVPFSAGYNGFGQLGTGDLGDRTVMGYLSGFPLFSGVAAGGDHTVAVDSNGVVSCWGDNYYGQLGNGNATYSTVPVPTLMVSNVTAVAAGAYHSLALQQDGTVWAWGRNNYGQMGYYLGTYTYYDYPHQVTSSSTFPSFTNISSIAANGYHSLAVANGRVWAWGYNGTGQLGFDPIYSYSFAPVPIAAESFNSINVASVAAGGAFSYAVARDGTLWAWGYNGQGQLGNNSIIDSYLPVQVLKAGTLPVPLTGVVKAVAGIQHGLALLNDGTVWAWGHNRFGQLGINSRLDSLLAQQVVADAFGTPFTGATDISAFGASSMAMKGGVWYVWGDNSYGQLGIGSKDTQYYPVRMLNF